MHRICRQARDGRSKQKLLGVRRLDDETRRQQLFQLLNEIGIIQQLSTAEFNRRMPEGLHVSHFSVLNHLSRLGDGRTPVRIAAAFQVTKATMTNTLSKLSARGFIEIRSNPDDGRSKLVYLTPDGREFQKRALAAVGPVLDQINEKLDVDTILGILPKLQELREFLDVSRSN